MISDKLKAFIKEGENRRKRATKRLIKRVFILEMVIITSGVLLLYFTGHELLLFFGEGIESNYPLMTFTWMMVVILMPLVAGILVVIRSNAPLVNFMDEEEADMVRGEFSRLGRDLPQ